MITSTPYKCDVCGIEKQAVNHWIIVEPCFEGGYVTNWWTDIEKVAPAIIDEPSTKHICGHQCYHKFSDQWLSGKVEQKTEAATEVTA